MENDVVAVHCVIIGFSVKDRRNRTIFNEDASAASVKKINSYLVDADNCFLHSVSSPLCEVPPIRFGSMPRGKAFIMSENERDEIVKKYPFVYK